MKTIDLRSQDNQSIFGKSLIEFGLKLIGELDGNQWYRIETDKGRIMAKCELSVAVLYFSASLVGEEDSYTVRCHSIEQIEQVLTVMI